MKLKTPNLLLLFFFFIFLQLASAQKLPVKWGKVDQADLDMTVYPLDSTANAVILADFGSLRFEFGGSAIRYVLAHHRRIKILNRAGFSEGDISIPYYGDDDIISLKAQIINPDGSEVKLKKSDLFEEKVTDSKSVKKFSFPNVQEGSIIEYAYELHSEHYFQLEEWYFQSHLPIRWSEYRLEIPEWFKYIALNQGRPLDISDRKYENKSVYFTGIGPVTVQMEQHQYVMKDVPALKEENYITTIYDYLARIKFQLNSFQFPESPTEPVLSSWPKVAEGLLNHPNFGQQFLKRRNFKKIAESIAPLLSEAGTDAEKVGIIYHALTAQIKWNGLYHYMAAESLDDCFLLKEANSGEFNLMMIALLQEQGIKAYPILISTRTHGKMISLYPIISQFNHVLALVDLDGQTMLIDANSPFRPIGFPRINSLNGQGWLVDKENSQWVILTPPESYQAGMIQVSINEEGQVSGSYNHRLKGYMAFDHRTQISTDKEGKFIQEELTERYPDIQIESCTIEKGDDPYEPLTENINFSLPYGAQVAGDFAYISPSLFCVFSENPLKAETRTYPVNMPYPFRTQRVVLLDIPEGYTVEELPEGIKLSLPNKGGSFIYGIKKIGEKLQVTSMIKISQTNFEPAEYPAIKGFFDMIIEKQQEQIVLKKKT